MLEDLPEEMSFLPPGQPAPVGPQPRRLFVIKVSIRLLLIELTGS